MRPDQTLPPASSLAVLAAFPLALLFGCVEGELEPGCEGEGELEPGCEAALVDALVEEVETGLWAGWPTATKTTATGATRWTTIASRSASMDPPTRVPAKRTSKTRTGAAASGSRAAICARAAEADVEEAKGKGQGEGKAKKTKKTKKTKTRAKGSGAAGRYG
ncbi:MAG: hypothetical protein J4F34_01895 [Gemmatimonadetes bacterium]|nr:hypothetical protein [Gemmatimonadota bacterium]